MVERRLPLSQWSISVLDLWNSIDRHREQLGVSFREVGRQAGVCSSTFSRMKDLRAPSANNFLRLCAWLEVNPLTFFGEPGRAKEGPARV